MNNSTIIELKEQNSINSDHNNPLGTNGHFNVELNSKNIHINNGDSIGIRSCFLDCVNENTGKIKIDITNNEITMKNCMYMTNFRTDAEGQRETTFKSPIATGELGQPNGKIYVVCEKINTVIPAGKVKAYVLTQARVDLKKTRISANFGGFSCSFNYTNQRGQPDKILLSWPDENKKDNGGIKHIDAKINGSIFLFGADPINVDFDFIQSSGPTRDERQKHYNIEKGEINFTFEEALIGDTLIPKEFTKKFTIPVGNYTPDLIARIITDNMTNLIDYPTNSPPQDKINNRLPVITAPAIYQTGASVYKETFPSRSIYGSSTKQLAYDNEFYGMNLDGLGGNGRTLFLVSADGLNILTFNNNEDSKNYFVGSSEMSLEFNPDDNKFVFSQLHTSQFNSSQLPIVKYFKDNLDRGFLSTAIGGCFFTDLQPPAFWSALGFDSSILCNPDKSIKGTYETQALVATYVDIITPSFLSIERGVNITADLAGIDASVDKILFNPAGAGADVVPDLTAYSDDQKEGTAVINNISIRATKPFQDIQHLDGYYIIQITGIPSIDFNLTPSQQISCIVSKYYTAGTYLIMEGGAGSFTYTHKGEHFYLQDLNIKIMESDGSPPTKLGNNNTIFLEINRAQNLLQF
jgi:hypothetical protein